MEGTRDKVLIHTSEERLKYEAREGEGRVLVDWLPVSETMPSASKGNLKV